MRDAGGLDVASPLLGEGWGGDALAVNAGQPTASGVTKLFVSYRHESTHAQLLARVILPRFLPPSIAQWVDVFQLDGDRWWASAEAAMEQCAAHVIIVDETVKLPPAGAIADPAALSSIGREILYARDNGLRPIYLAASLDDRREFLAANDAALMDDPSLAPDENVIVVLSTDGDWEQKLLDTVRKVTRYHIPVPTSWAAREHRGTITAYRGDLGGSVGLPLPDAHSGFASTSTGGHAVAGSLDEPIRVLQPRGARDPAAIGVLDIVGQPLALEQISRLRMRCIARRVTDVVVFDFELGGTDVSNLTAFADRVHDATLVDNRPAFITADHRLGGAADLLAGCAGPESKWFSLDSCTIGRQVSLVGIEQTDATRTVHVVEPGTPRSRTRLPGGEWESVRIVRSSSPQALVLAGTIAADFELREVSDVA